MEVIRTGKDDPLIMATHRDSKAKIVIQGSDEELIAMAVLIVLHTARAVAENNAEYTQAVRDIIRAVYRFEDDVWGEQDR